MRRFLLIAAVVAVAVVWFGNTAEACHWRHGHGGYATTVAYHGSSVGCCDPCASSYTYTSHRHAYRGSWRWRAHSRPWAYRMTYRPYYYMRQRGFYANYSPTYSTSPVYSASSNYSTCSTCGG